MPKLRKDKRVTFVDGVFHIETTVHLPGVRSRTIRGKPWIATTKDDVRLGCIRFDNAAMHEIIRLMALQARQPHSLKPWVHQVGNYGEAED